jgi:CoA:oxalate CoA-transferase
VSAASLPANSPAPLPLAGVRVVDFTRLLPGPWCTQMLVDMGADVVKIETPGTGDPSRHNPPRQREHSAYFASVNRGKRSVVLDLRSTDGLEAAHRLMARADIVIESFAVGVAARLGVDYASAKARKSNVIYCSITGFGQDGPLAQSPGHDLVVQATTGVLSSGGGGTMPPFQAADYAGGAFGVIAILAALQRRHATGEGSHLDIAMFDGLFAMSEIALLGALARAGGETGTPTLEVWGRNPRYCIYPTADGRFVAVSLLESRLWSRFCVVIGRPDLVFDEAPEDRHSDHGSRAALFRDAIAGYCGNRNAATINREMRAQDIPVSVVLTPDEALASEHARARGMAIRTHDRHDGEGVRIGSPLERAGLARTAGHSPPRLGEHTAEVLAEVGMTSAAGERQS